MCMVAIVAVAYRHDKQHTDEDLEACSSGELLAAPNLFEAAPLRSAFLQPDLDQPPDRL
jgi:hypothetical protein